MDATGSRCGTPSITCWNLCIGEDNRRVVLQLVEAAVSDHIAGIDTFYLGSIPIGGTGPDTLHVCCVVLNHIDVRYLSVVLYRGRWDQGGPVQCIDQKADIYKFICEQGWNRRFGIKLALLLFQWSCQFDCPESAMCRLRLVFALNGHKRLRLICFSAVDEAVPA